MLILVMNVESTVAMTATRLEVLQAELELEQLVGAPAPKNSK